MLTIDRRWVDLGGGVVLQAGGTGKYSEHSGDRLLQLVNKIVGAYCGVFQNRSQRTFCDIMVSMNGHRNGNFAIAHHEMMASPNSLDDISEPFKHTHNLLSTN